MTEIPIGGQNIIMAGTALTKFFDLYGAMLVPYIHPYIYKDIKNIKKFIHHGNYKSVSFLFYRISNEILNYKCEYTHQYMPLIISLKTFFYKAQDSRLDAYYYLLNEYPYL